MFPAGPAKIILKPTTMIIVFGSFKGKRKFSAFLLNGTGAGWIKAAWDEQNMVAGMIIFHNGCEDDVGLSFMWNGNTDDEPLR